MSETETYKAPIWRYDEEREGEFPYCPVCESRTVNTPSGAVICGDCGSEHYREDADTVLANKP